jgi:hypothetical protein
MICMTEVGARPVRVGFLLGQGEGVSMVLWGRGLARVLDGRWTGLRGNSMHDQFVFEELVLLK